MQIQISFIDRLAQGKLILNEGLYAQTHIELQQE